MKREMFQALFAYHWHTNARMIAGAEKLDDFFDPDAG
jgi:hypothetical protein